MRYVLVNGRTPFRRFTCAACGEEIGNSYLRETSTHLYYCDPGCYSDHCNTAVVAIANRTRALVGLAPIGKTRSAEAELSALT
jgi:hypothetical protein